MADASDRGWGQGWPSGTTATIDTAFEVTGTRFPGGVRKELAELVRRLVQECKDRGYRFGNEGDASYGCWGYQNRAISGTDTPSNHSWGLAVDINAPCLAAGTQVVTRHGPVTIEQLAERGTEVELLTTLTTPTESQEPVWRKATVRSYGAAPTYDVVLSRRGRRHTVRTTGEHRWFTHWESYRASTGGYFRRRRELTTTDLNGSTLRHSERVMAIEYPPFDGVVDSEGVAWGIVYGDGSIGNPDRPNPVGYVELIGAKEPDLRHYLEPYARSWHAGTVGARAWGLPVSWKALPEPWAPGPVLAGFFAGWFATDGTVSKNGLPALSSSNPDAVAWLTRIAPSLGLVISGIKASRTGLSARPNHEIRFLPRSLAVDLVLRPHHRVRLQARAATADATLSGWRVESVTSTGLVEEVYCPDVAHSAAFALHTGGVPLLTGNSNPHKDPPCVTDMPDWMPDLWTAYGFRWGGTYSRPDAMHYEFMGTPQDCARHTDQARTAGLGDGGTTPTPIPPPIGDVPPFPFPPGHWMGVESSDDRNHSGYHETDQPGIAQYQERLRARGWELDADGLFGPITEQTTRDYQAEHGLQCDGLCGIDTWTSIWTDPIT